MIRDIERENQLGWGGFRPLPELARLDLIGDWLARNLDPKVWAKAQKSGKRDQFHRRRLVQKHLWGVTDGD